MQELESGVRKMRRIAIFGALAISIIWPSVAKGQGCETLIALSREQSTVVESDSMIASHAESFCKEYKSGNRSSRSSAFGASYEFLSGTFSSGRASEAQVASRYCAAADSNSAATNYYERYINSIAPGAYDAYKQCLDSRDSDVIFRVDPNSVLKDQFNLTATFQRPGIGQANLFANGSDGVSCLWNGGNSSRFRLRSPGTATLTCKRASFAERDFVTVAVENGTEKITIPWAAYTVEGYPVFAIAELKRANEQLKLEIDNLSQQIRSIGTTANPESAVRLQWNSTGQCPPGYYVSGVSDPSAHGRENKAPRALIAFSLSCTRFLPKEG